VQNLILHRMVIFLTRIIVIELKPYLYPKYYFVEDFFQKYRLSGFVPQLELTLEMVELTVEYDSASNGTIFNYDYQAKTRSQDHSGASFRSTSPSAPLFCPMTLVENSTLRRKIKFYIQLNS